MKSKVLVWRPPKVGDLVHPLIAGDSLRGRPDLWIDPNIDPRGIADHRVGLVLQERGIEVKIRWCRVDRTVAVSELWHKRTQVIVIQKETS